MDEHHQVLFHFSLILFFEWYPKTIFLVFPSLLSLLLGTSALGFGCHRNVWPISTHWQSFIFDDLSINRRDSCHRFSLSRSTKSNRTFIHWGWVEICRARIHNSSRRRHRRSISCDFHLRHGTSNIHRGGRGDNVVHHPINAKGSGYV